MRVFNGRAATEDYMSTHSLTFSTPEMTLKKFALWLGEQIDSPNNKGQQIPRLIAYLQDKEKKKGPRDYVPDISDRFEPSGAVTDMFKDFSDRDANNKPPQALTKPSSDLIKTEGNNDKDRFCIECGSKLRPASKFCTGCGTRQP